MRPVLDIIFDRLLSKSCLGVDARYFGGKPSIKLRPMPEQQAPKPLTDKQRRALAIIRDRDIQSPTHFGRLMWPDSDSWRRRGKCGPYGSSAGVGMRLASGAYLGKLQKAGFIHVTFGSAFVGQRTYRLTELGRRSLELAMHGEDATV